MANEEKQNANGSNGEQRVISRVDITQGEVIIKSQIPDFKFSAPVPDKPSTTTTDKTDK